MFTVGVDGSVIEDDPDRDPGVVILTSINLRTGEAHTETFRFVGETEDEKFLLETPGGERVLLDLIDVESVQ